MGGHITCDRVSDSLCAGGCSFTKDCFTCSSEWEGHIRNNFTECATSTRAVGLEVILPIFLISAFVAAVWMLWKWRQLREIREVQQGYNAALRAEFGAFAAGASSYSTSNDLLPYIAPCGLRGWCMTKRVDVKLLSGVGFLTFLLAVVFFPLGTFRTAGTADWYPTFNSQHLGEAGLAMAVISCLACCLSCLLRFCYSQENYEEAVAMQQQQRVVLGEAVPPAHLYLVPVPQQQQMYNAPQPQQIQMQMQMQQQPEYNQNPLQEPMLPLGGVQQQQQQPQPPAGYAQPPPVAQGYAYV